MNTPLEELVALRSLLIEQRRSIVRSALLEPNGELCNELVVKQGHIDAVNQAILAEQVK
jgi:hypothetical protein